MAHVCKCVYCGQKFDRDKLPFVEVRKLRYAHKECYEGKDPPIVKEVIKDKETGKKKIVVTQPKVNQELIDKDNLDDYLFRLYDGDYDYGRTRLLIDSYIKKYHYTYSGIRKALIYFHEVKGNPVDKEGVESRSIGIVPYIYDEARRYYYKLWQANEKNKGVNIADYIPKKVEVTIPKPQRKVKKDKRFSFLDEEVEVDGK